VSPDGNRVQVFNGSPAVMNGFANSDWQERLKWGGHAVRVAWAPNQRVFNGSSAVDGMPIEIDRKVVEMGWACSTSSMAPNQRVFYGSSAMGGQNADVADREPGKG